MKPFDVDARHLIRTYIDGIEVYLRDHTRLHPNEIDSLLNEINDFVYLRSGELATGDRVHYNDVIKAIEECGSPSEICEQYLELDREEQPGPFSPKVAPASSKQASIKSPVEDYPSKTRKSPKRFQSSLNKLSFYYRRVPWFTLYRGCFIFGMVMLNLSLLRYNAFYDYGRIWVYDLHNYWAYDRCFAATMMAFFLVLLEGWLINRWKKRIVDEKGFDRNFDDTIVVYTSRFTFLMLFLKSSLFYLPAYLIFTPIWVILACIIERQMKSELWQEKLGPWIIGFGSSLTNDQHTQSRISVTSLWTKFNDQFSNLEKRVIAFLIVILGVTFTFPWIGLRTEVSQPIYLYYTVEGLPLAAAVFVIISLLTMGGTLVALWKYNSSYELRTFTGESELIAWLMRLLALKTILILDFVFISPVFYFGSLVILGVLITFEIVSNTYGGETFRLWVGNALLSFGSTSSPQRDINTSQTPPKSHMKEQSSPLRSGTVVYSPQKPTVVPLHQNVPEPTTAVEKAVFTTEKRPSKLSGVFNGMWILVKVFIMTIMMCVISFFEVVLSFLVLVTSFNSKGIYEVPVLEFSGYFSVYRYSSSSFVLGGYAFTMWYTLILLSIQVFFIVTFLWYGLTTKKPEGTILKVFRNLTRILLGFTFIGILIFQFQNSFAQLQLLIIFGLVFFSETTAWKVRSERKKFPLPTSDQELPVPNKEGMILDQAELPKTS